MRKKLKFLVLDCETATCSFANEIANGDAEKKKKIAIARPLIYDIGWVIIDRSGNVQKKFQALITETFAVPQIFNTAYYADKRPIYLEMLKRGETCLMNWNEAMKEFSRDLEIVNFVGAYNSAFDFKKAIPFTELYISKLYSPNYQEWEAIQRTICWNIANKPYKKNPEKEYNPNVFNFRGNEYPLFDVWGMACEHLINTAKYKNACLDGDMLSASGEFFKTSAETSFRYLTENYGFEEAHTALNDAEIEAQLLARMLKRHAVSVGIEPFPFRNLGTTVEFLEAQKNVKEERIRKVLNVMDERKECYEEGTSYRRKLENYIERLINLL